MIAIRKLYELDADHPLWKPVKGVVKGAAKFFVNLGQKKDFDLEKPTATLGTRG